MDFSSDFIPLQASDIHSDAERRSADGWRYVQILAVNKDEGVDLVFSYMKDGLLENLVVSDVARDAHVDSISDVFFESFVCENEIHDLFGVTFDGLVLDFLGNFYRLSTEKPMTIISPEQLAEREKQRKIAAAKAAKEAKDAAKASGDAAGDPKASEEDMEAKLAAMDPEKAAKVRAAMEAKAKKEAAAKDAELEAKLADMDPEKAAKVRAAMEAKRAKEAAEGKGE